MMANATFRPARILLDGNFGNGKKRENVIKISLTFLENGLVKKKDNLEVKIEPWDSYIYEKLQRLLKDAIDDYYDGKNSEGRVK